MNVEGRGFTAWQDIKFSEDGIGEKSLRGTAVDVLAFSAAFLFCVFAMAFAIVQFVMSLESESSPSFPMVWANVKTWMVELGAALGSEVGWGLGIYATLLIGFYAASLTRQQAAKARDLAIGRWRLGVAAKLLAATLPLYVAFVGCAWLYGKDTGGPLAMMLVPSAALMYLSCELGRLIVVDQEKYEKSLRSVKAESIAILRLTGPMVGKPFGLIGIWIFNLVVPWGITVTAFYIFGIGELSSEFTLYSSSAVILISAISVCAYMYLLRCKSSISYKILTIFIVFVWISFFLLINTQILIFIINFSEVSWGAFAPLIIGSGTVFVSGFIPLQDGTKNSWSLTLSHFVWEVKRWELERRLLRVRRALGNLPNVPQLVP